MNYSRRCKNGSISDTDGIHSIDEAVAYWIGDGQIAGDKERGHLLYALAEEMGENFQMVDSGQSRTNTNILRLFNQAKLELNFPDACSEDPGTYPRLRRIVNKIVSVMTVPLVQGLIHNLRVNDRDRVKLYAQAFVPLTAACDPDLFAFLYEKLISLTYNAVEVEDIVERIRNSYDCLGIRCDDVGQHFTESNDICIDTPYLESLAGYRPGNDVRQFGLLDLDILEASILMDMKAYGAVEDLYKYGKHGVGQAINGEEVVSLAQLATTNDRSIVPEFDSFVRYFDDSKYADTIIRKGLDMNELIGASDVQRKEVVVKSMSFLVVFMAAWQYMYTSIQICESSGPIRPGAITEAWDRAAALLIGSLEGTELGGAPYGQSLYALANQRCTAFGTCSGTSGKAEANEQLLLLLYTGRGEGHGNSCAALRRTVSEIVPIMLVPLVQSNLISAVENAKQPRGTQAAILADGYIFSRSVLPLVEDVSRDAATTINRNLELQFSIKPVPDGPSAVFFAFAGVYNGMNVDCVKLGQTDGLDPCSGANQGRGGMGGLMVGLIVCTVAVIVSVGGFLVRRRYLRKANEEHVSFVKSNGELNHATDILAGKHNDADVLASDEAFDGNLQRRAQDRLDALSLT